VNAFVYGKLPAKSAETQWIYVIDPANEMNSGGSETEMSRRSCIQMVIHRHGILAANEDCMQFLYNC